MSPLFGRMKPILYIQSWHSTELPKIICDEDGLRCQSMRRYKHVIGSDDGSLRLQVNANSPIVPVGFYGERKHIDHLQ